MLKRFFISAIFVSILFLLASCGGNEEASNEKDDEETEESSDNESSSDSYEMINFTEDFEPESIDELNDKEEIEIDPDNFTSYEAFDFYDAYDGTIFAESDDYLFLLDEKTEKNFDLKSLDKKDVPQDSVENQMYIGVSWGVVSDDTYIYSTFHEPDLNDDDHIVKIDKKERTVEYLRKLEELEMLIDAYDQYILITDEDEGTFTLYDSEKKEDVWSIDSFYMIDSEVVDDELLIYGESGIFIYDFETGEEKVKNEDEEITNAVFYEDEVYAVYKGESAADFKYTVARFDVETGELDDLLETPTMPITPDSEDLDVEVINNTLYFYFEIGLMAVDLEAEEIKWIVSAGEDLTDLFEEDLEFYVDFYDDRIFALINYGDEEKSSMAEIDLETGEFTQYYDFPEENQHMTRPIYDPIKEELIYMQKVTQMDEKTKTYLLPL